MDRKAHYVVLSHFSSKIRSVFWDQGKTEKQIIAWLLENKVNVNEYSDSSDVNVVDPIFWWMRSFPLVFAKFANVIDPTLLRRENPHSDHCNLGHIENCLEEDFLEVCSDDVAKLAMQLGVHFSLRSATVERMTKSIYNGVVMKLYLSHGIIRKKQLAPLLTPETWATLQQNAKTRIYCDWQLGRPDLDKTFQTHWTHWQDVWAQCGKLAPTLVLYTTQDMLQNSFLIPFVVAPLCARAWNVIQKGLQGCSLF